MLHLKAIKSENIAVTTAALQLQSTLRSDIKLVTLIYLETEKKSFSF